jgi:hypothetical protein
LPGVREIGAVIAFQDGIALPDVLRSDAERAERCRKLVLAYRTAYPESSPRAVFQVDKRRAEVRTWQLLLTPFREDGAKVGKQHRGFAPQSHAHR